ncbi:ribosome recycling factor [Proteinivorax hydrogeniformans]|uniref:Ribosome-recycling factor n=1 Tax=Proteinivorax hydrogeniformans TaxID=1826727 RepID=A0AAU8HNX7_9FIRM
MVNDIYSDLKTRMKKAVESLQTELNSVRAGRATPSLLDRIVVDYYGAQTPLNQLANISTPEPRLLVVQPWDKTVIPEVEKAILKSDLGLTPSNDGSVIRLAIPALTQERRSELVRYVKQKGEDGKVAIRNVRRDGNEMVKSLEKDNEISEDESRKAQEEIQKITDQFIKEADRIIQNKEEEILEV